MKLVPCKCPNCGAELEIDESRERSFCQYCGSQFVVEKAIDQQRLSIEGTVQVKETDFVIRAGTLQKYNGESSSVIIPNTVTNIGEEAFAHLAVTSVTIPDSVKVIEKKAFFQCNALTSIVIPQSVTEIKEKAFSECVSLQSVEINGSVVMLGLGAFEQCTFLKKVSIANGMEKTGDEVFKGCYELTTVVLPSTVKIISNKAFSGCIKLSSCIFSNSLETIGYRAFWRCESLTKIELPGSLKCIDDDAFTECTSLDDVVFGGDSYRKAKWDYKGFVDTPFIAKEWKKYYQKQGVCQYCGRSFSGLFVKKCSNCGRRKDY